MQQLVDALLSSLPPNSLHAGQDDVSFERRGTAWQCGSRQGSQEFDEIILAIPGPAAAALLQPLRAELAGMLSGIQYTSSAAVLIAFDRADLPPGFGFLVPRSEGRKMLACTFVHKKFPHRAPEGSALLRCFFSSSRVRKMSGYSDAALLDLAHPEFQEIMDFTATPRFARVFRWECALPQYALAQPQRVAQMEKHLAELPGVRLIGNSLYGVGISDCIKSAQQAVGAITSAALQPASV